MGVQAFERIDPADGLRFEWFDRIPRERGLGSSASIIALGLVAAAHRRPGPRPGVAPLGGPAAGGPPTTSRPPWPAEPASRWAGGSNTLPTTSRWRRSPSCPPPGWRPRRRGRAARAGTARRRRVHGRSCRHPRRRSRHGPDLFAMSLTDRLHEAYRAEHAPTRGGALGPAARRPRRHHLGIGPDGDRLGGEALGRRLRGRALLASRTWRCCGSRSRRRSGSHVTLARPGHR